MKQRLESGGTGRDQGLSDLFTALFGAFLGLTLIKFGNPPIMEKWVTAPSNAYEFVLGNPWPIAWAYGLLGVLVIIGLLVAKPIATAPRWLLVLPLCWLFWQCIASRWSADFSLSKPTLAHFFGCTACFYLGLFSLSATRRFAWFWPGLITGLAIVIAVGWEQHFGGLDQTRRYFFLYIYPRLKEVPPEYLKKIASTRIFSTLFYPNALAGALLLVLPPVLQVVWQRRDRFTIGARLLLISLIAVGALGCLYWSGSKGGWLLMLILGLLWMLRLPLSPAHKRNLLVAVLMIGLAGFFLKYAGFFEKGATSVSARFDYWRAAGQTTFSHPWFGTGPGTFSIAYQKVKRPEAEMARLVHNDYLEQGSDSGLPGLFFYSAFVFSALILGYPPAPKPSSAPSGKQGPSTAPAGFEGQVQFLLWLGVLGWILQGFLEFGLYLPALAWPAFAFFGLLLGYRYRYRQAVVRQSPGRSSCSAI